MSEELAVPKELPYKAEYAKSRMSACKKCKEKIDKGELRMGVMVQSPHFDGRIPMWHHFSCFFLRSKVKSLGDIEHYETLRWEDQERLKKKIQGGGDDDEPKAAKGKGKKSKAKEKAGGDDLKEFSVEYAKSSRSSCKSCEEKIEKGVIRISKMDYDSASALRYGPLPRWYHVKCFIKEREDLEFFYCADSLPGFNSLTPEDRQTLKTKIKKIEGGLKRKKADEASTEPSTSQPTKKQKLEESKEEKVLKEQNKLFYKYQDALRATGLTRPQLQELLYHNDQEVPQGDNATIAALADCMAFGAPKPCPECQGQLVYKAHGYTCRGNITAWTRCLYTTKKPEKVPFKIPEEFTEKVPFLAKYKYKERERQFPTKIELPSAQKDMNGKKLNPLAKLKINSCGHLTRSKEQFKTDVEALGGTVHTHILNSTDLIISTEKEASNDGSKKMMKAKILKIPVVDEKFLDEVTQGGAAIMATKYCLRDWGVNVQEHITNRINAANSNKEEQAFTKNLPDKLRLMVKGGVAVDPDSELAHCAHVLKRGKEIFSAVLGQVDIVRGTNSFYKLQLLEADSSSGYWVFRSWGRVGTTIGGNKVEEFDSRHDAELEFKRLYEEKTGNMWSNRDQFVKIPGKFYPLDLDYGPKEESHAVLKPGQSSKLDLAVQNLICLIFDVENMKKAMMEFEIDLKKMPLGKLSKKQLEAAYFVLSELQELVNKEDASESRLVDAANRFYTLIPHDFGMRKPPLIRTTDVIKAKIDMLDSLLEIELAYNMLKEKPDGQLDVDPVDQHYLQLKADISVVPADSPTMDMIRQYVANTHAATHSSYSLEIEDVFMVSRHIESKRFKPFLKLHNHKLLWHGSRITNFAGILSQGLRIAPPEAPSTGYMFGKGLYFADMVSKSANYCCSSRSNPYGLLLLCRVALGSMYERRNADYIEKLPAAKHSTKGLGQTIPDPSMSVTLTSGVEVPLGKGIEADVGRTSLLYNEYIVYDKAQATIEYLLKVKFNYRR